MRERSDEEHLLWAAAQKRTLYSFNVRDYCRFHAEFIAQGRSHAGIIVAKQQRYSVGEQIAEVAETNRDQVGGGNDKQNRVSQRLGVIEALPVWCRPSECT